MIEFPKDFLWGAATSSYQVEGNNANSDWWEWEKKAGLKDTSGLACRHYELYKEDFDLAKELNHNAHRFSIEWSRIQPQKNTFSDAELAHYKDVVLSLRERGLEPVVTLHHFTNPAWFASLSGWLSADAPDYFSRYVEKIVDTLSDSVRYWVTINEPMVYVYYSYILGAWVPQKKSLALAKKVTDNLVRAHIQAYKLIHDIYRRKNLHPCFVSIANNTQAFVPCVNTLRNRLAAYLRDENFNFAFIKRLMRKNSLDFIGINYYTRGLVETRSWSLKSLLTDNCISNHSRLKKNTMGWDIYPEGLYDLLLKFKKYDLPLLILENGICTEDDTLRWDYIREHLISIHRAIEKGAGVRGYIYWSLLDNFEWDKGFSQRFGLIALDYVTYKRTARESAKRFALVCKTGRLD